MTDLSTFIWMFIFAFQIGTLNSSGFRTTVSKWQNKFKSSDFCKDKLVKCKSQITIAVKKGKTQLGDHEDIKAAVEMINTYTSNIPATYKMTNAVLRGQSNIGLSNSDEDMFREFAKVVVMSIDLLCNKFPKLCGKYRVYRGEGYCVSVNSSTYTFKSFLSTTKSIGIAGYFFYQCPKSSVLFYMTEVKGIYISQFSVFAGEEEVLVKPTAIFQINENMNSTEDETQKVAIINKVKSLNGSVYPVTFIQGTMIGFTSASTTLYSPKYVGTASTLIVVYTFISI